MGGVCIGAPALRLTVLSKPLYSRRATPAVFIRFLKALKHVWTRHDGGTRRPGTTLGLVRSEAYGAGCHSLYYMLSIYNLI